MKRLMVILVMVLTVAVVVVAAKMVAYLDKHNGSVVCFASSQCMSSA